jgi:hypothetical protein
VEDKRDDMYLPICSFENISAALPPTTLRNAEAQNPVMNLNKKYTANVNGLNIDSGWYSIANLPGLGANMTGHENTKSRPYEARYTIFRPYISDNGPTNSGPKPSPATNRLRASVETTLDM